MKYTCAPSYNAYRIRSAACLNIHKQFNCDAYSSDPGFASLVTDCSPEALCKDAEVLRNPLNYDKYCTGVKDAAVPAVACAKDLSCMEQVPLATLRQIGTWEIGAVEGVIGLFKNEHDVVQSFTSHPAEASKDTVRGGLEYNRRWQCFNNSYHIAFSCHLYTGILGAEMMAEMAKRAPSTLAEGTTAIVENAKSFAAATGERQAFVRGMLKKQFTTVSERKSYVDLALKTEPDGRTMFLDVQNSYMKALNDTLKDKNLVTALTNKRLQMTFDGLQALRKKYPQIEALNYDDFKSGRVAFRSSEGAIPPGFQKDVSEIIDKTNRDFAALVLAMGVVDAKSKDKLPPPDKWFTSGWGATGDQANAAARYARRDVGANPMRSFSEGIIQRNLQQGLQNTERIRAGLAQSGLKNTTLLEMTPGGQLIPSMDVFEAYRKTNNAKEFAKAITERTGQPISGQMAQNLRNYIDSVNELSPSIHIVEARQIVSFSGSKANGVMADVTSMGALNLSKEAEALSRSKSVTDAVVKSREGEQAATQTFNTNKDAIVKAGQDALKGSGVKLNVLVSGDDILFQPNRRLTEAELSKLHQAIAESPSGSNVRLSAVAPGVKNANLVGVQGELLEKKTRSLTLASVPGQNNYTLMVVSDTKGVPQLQVRTRSGAPVAPDVETSFQAAFAKALETH